MEGDFDVDTAPDLIGIGDEYIKDGVYVDEDNYPAESEIYNAERFGGGRRGRRQAPVLMADICGNRIDP